MFAMHRALFLFCALLLCCDALESSAPRRVLALAGEAVILPCHTSHSDNFPTVEWSKAGLVPNVVVLYRDGCETHDMKNPAFWYRTSLIMNELKNGNISLRISNVKLSDAGKYTCKTIHKGDHKDVVLELVVVAVSEPKLSAVPTEGGGMTLLCEANCWYLEPEMTFLDRGNTINAEDPKSELDSRGCFNITRRATVQTATNRITCRVHEPNRNQTRVAEIYIPGCMSSCTAITIIAVVLAVLLCGLGLCAAYIYKTYFCSAEEQKWLISQQLSHQTTPDRTEVCYPCTGNQAEDTAEHLRHIEDLRSTLLAKDEIIQKPTAQLNEANSRQIPCSSPESAVPAQSYDKKPGVLKDNLAFGRTTQRRSHNQSCPALLMDSSADSPTSSSASPSEKLSIVRTKSLSVHSRNQVKPKRRNTTSVVSSNHCNYLIDLPEDKELLLDQPDQVN
uniref:butyrophilin subfamily 3 member A2-like isoform X3 n=1 Tax=Semicossyphus pulcher TaxID=241346 RepID=UPI0037E88BC4